jgi:hypothetical protein
MKGKVKAGERMKVAQDREGGWGIGQRCVRRSVTVSIEELMGTTEEKRGE